MPKPLLPTEGDDPTATEMANDDVLRVLVIDDNVDVAAFIGSQLSDKYAIITHTNGHDG